MCPDAEDRFYAAAERLGCGCPEFSCGAWWPFHATPKAHESASRTLGPDRDHA